jgi:hypothetical protein
MGCTKEVKITKEEMRRVVKDRITRNFLKAHKIGYGPVLQIPMDVLENKLERMDATLLLAEDRQWEQISQLLDEMLKTREPEDTGVTESPQRIFRFVGCNLVPDGMRTQLGPPDMEIGGNVQVWLDKFCGDGEFFTPTKGVPTVEHYHHIVAKASRLQAEVDRIRAEGIARPGRHLSEDMANIKALELENEVDKLKRELEEEKEMRRAAEVAMERKERQRKRLENVLLDKTIVLKERTEEKNALAILRNEAVARNAELNVMLVSMEKKVWEAADLAQTSGYMLERAEEIISKTNLMFMTRNVACLQAGFPDLWEMVQEYMKDSAMEQPRKNEKA